jgi:hypothetical protein
LQKLSARNGFAGRQTQFATTDTTQAGSLKKLVPSATKVHQNAEFVFEGTVER